MNRFRNDNHIILKEETKGCLCSSFSVFFIDLCQNRIGVLELKVDHKPEEAIAQIKEKEYALRFQGKTAERKEDEDVRNHKSDPVRNRGRNHRMASGQQHRSYDHSR